MSTTRSLGTRSWLKSTFPKNIMCSPRTEPRLTRPRNVQEFCKENMASFWPTDFWPSSSPNVNPLDFAVWGFLEGKTKKKNSHPPHHQQGWDNMSEDFIKTSCASVRPRIEAIIRNNGGCSE
ncbi:Uncharacterized protein FKW44_006668 [Caligus rogercresseyi]|uniref:Uncharacterized protein n=1 Tax=Caligus rogercresseyi TaxID=217165 RepID=A0A7T8KDP4_CALRO|nr:Uncharacterized protein FKW44_006668 [Caligus rogercresseyi]